jgi:hypothetical protein
MCRDTSSGVVFRLNHADASNGYPYVQNKYVHCELSFSGNQEAPGKRHPVDFRSTIPMKNLMMIIP